MVDGIKYFQTYLYGKRFVFLTDHHALKWLFRFKEPTGRLARWSLLLQQFDFEIKHRSGTSNGNGANTSLHLMLLTNLASKQTAFISFSVEMPLSLILSTIWRIISYPPIVRQLVPYSLQLMISTLTKMAFCVTFGPRGRVAYPYLTLNLLSRQLYAMNFSWPLTTNLTEVDT